ncbi:MAG: YceI family protein [Acidobacteriaceae bacterium]|nr:YceI family protein [Acidobacteriaceae bacterium]
MPSNDSTLAVEIYKTGLTRRKKHLLFFEKFRGELTFSANLSEPSKIKLEVDSTSIACRDKWLSPKRQEQISRYATDVLAPNLHPEIQFQSTSFSRKPIRGFEIEGMLRVRDTNRAVKVNIVINQTKPDILQIDGDATFRLSDFGINRHFSWFGLVRTEDEVLVRLLLWATRQA